MEVTINTVNDEDGDDNDGGTPVTFISPTPTSLSSGKRAPKRRRKLDSDEIRNKYQPLFDRIGEIQEKDKED